MNKTVSLVNEWGAFEKKHPDGSIEDFCRYVLTHAKKDKQPPVKGPLEPNSEDSMLIRLMGRIMLLHSVYADKALEGTGLNSVEEFAMLNTVLQLKHPKKSEVIQACLHEVSTGTDILNRIRKSGYLTEKDDTEDRRSKRLSITTKGEKVVTAARARVAALAKMMLNEMDPDDKKLAFQLLKPVETKFGAVIQQHKGKTFEAIFESLVKEKINKPLK